MLFKDSMSELYILNLILMELRTEKANKDVCILPRQLDTLLLNTIFFTYIFRYIFVTQLL